MREFLKAIGCLLVLVLGANARAITPYADRYHEIPERNLFGLKPVEPPPTQQPPPVLTRKMILNGITTLLGYKRALLKVEPFPGKAGEKEISMILAEGQREGDIEVLEIDEHAGRVKVNNGGVIATLTFDKDGAKVQSTASAPAPLPQATAPTMPAAPTATAPPDTGLTRRNLRASRWQQNLGAVPATAPTNPSPAAETSTGAPAPPVAAGGASLPQDLTPEEQAIVLALQQQANQNTNPQVPLPPNTLPPAAPGVTAPALSSPGLKPPQTTMPIIPGARPPVLPQ